MKYCVHQLIYFMGSVFISLWRGTYGEGCNKTCGHCRDDEECYHTNGTCSNGCNPGYFGDLCMFGKYKNGVNTSQLQNNICLIGKKFIERDTQCLELVVHVTICKTKTELINCNHDNKLFPQKILSSLVNRKGWDWWYEWGNQYWSYQSILFF